MKQGRRDWLACGVRRHSFRRVCEMLCPCCWESSWFFLKKIGLLLNSFSEHPGAESDHFHWLAWPCVCPFSLTRTQDMRRPNLCRGLLSWPLERSVWIITVESGQRQFPRSGGVGGLPKGKGRCLLPPVFAFCLVSTLKVEWKCLFVPRFPVLILWPPAPTSQRLRSEVCSSTPSSGSCTALLEVSSSFLCH